MSRQGLVLKFLLSSWRNGHHNLILDVRADDAWDDWGAPAFVRQGVFDAANRQWQERCALSTVALDENAYIEHFALMIAGADHDVVHPNVWGTGTHVRRVRFDRCLRDHLIAYSNRI